MGCIYRAKKNGKEYGNYLIAYRSEDGRRIVESTRTTIHKDAKALLASREGSIADGKPIEFTGRKTVYTFEAATEAILTHYTNENTARSRHVLERMIARNMAPFFAGMRMGAITYSTIDRYIAHRLGAGASRGTVKIELAHLSKMFTLGIVAERLKYRPKFPKLTLDNARKGFFEPAEAEAVIAHLTDPWADLITLARWLGWRTQSEIAPLEWWEVDRVNKTITLDPARAKNGEGRLFPYAAIPAVHEVIERMHARREALKAKGVITRRVFVTAEGAEIVRQYDKHGYMLPREFRTEWAEACRLAGVAGRIPHDFRRTAVRSLVWNGVPEKTAMELTGHKTRSVFDRYHIVSKENLAQAVAMLAKGMGVAPAPPAPEAPPAPAPKARKPKAAKAA